MRIPTGALRTAMQAVMAGAGSASGKDGSRGGGILVTSEALGGTTGNGGCDVAANSDGAQAGSSDCAMGMGNRSAEFSWDWAWSTADGFGWAASNDGGGTGGTEACTEGTENGGLGVAGT